MSPPQGSGGAYLSLVTTSLRGDMAVRLFSPWMDTSLKCLRFFYQFIGDAMSSVAVTIVNENNDVIQEEIMQRNASAADWKIFFTQLPSGLNYVAITGLRGSNGTSGIRIDDVELTSCQDFEGK